MRATVADGRLQPAILGPSPVWAMTAPAGSNGIRPGHGQPPNVSGGLLECRWGRVVSVETTDGHNRPRANQWGKRMALTDILNKLGGQKGEQGGLAAISKLFDGDGMQGILSKLQASGLDKQVMSWIGHGQNEPVTGDDIKNAVDPQQLSKVAQESGMSQDEVADHVAQALPEAVDKATPAGAVPQQGFSMDTLMGMFKK